MVATCLAGVLPGVACHGAPTRVPPVAQIGTASGSVSASADPCAKVTIPPASGSPRTLARGPRTPLRTLFPEQAGTGAATNSKAVGAATVELGSVTVPYVPVLPSIVVRSWMRLPSEVVAGRLEGPAATAWTSYRLVADGLDRLRDEAPRLERARSACALVACPELTCFERRKGEIEAALADHETRAPALREAAIDALTIATKAPSGPSSATWLALGAALLETESAWGYSPDADKALSRALDAETPGSAMSWWSAYLLAQVKESLGRGPKVAAQLAPLASIAPPVRGSVLDVQLRLAENSEASNGVAIAQKAVLGCPEAATDEKREYCDLLYGAWLSRSIELNGWRSAIDAAAGALDLAEVSGGPWQDTATALGRLLGHLGDTGIVELPTIPAVHAAGVATELARVSLAQRDLDTARSALAVVHGKGAASTPVMPPMSTKQDLAERARALGESCLPQGEVAILLRVTLLTGGSVQVKALAAGAKKLPTSVAGCIELRGPAFFRGILVHARGTLHRPAPAVVVAHHGAPVIEPIVASK